MNFLVVLFLLAISLNKLIIAIEHHEDDPHPKQVTSKIIQQSTCNDCILNANESKIECVNKQNFNLYEFKNQCLSQYTNFPIQKYIINNYNFSGYLNETLFDKRMENLTYLDLSNNRITSLHAIFFKNTPNLQYLILDRNQLAFDNETSFVALSGVSNSLLQLSLQNSFNNQNDFLENSRSINKNLKKLFEISRLNKLETINLQNNNLRFFNFEKPEMRFDEKDFLCLNPNLKYLHLESNLIESIIFRVNCSVSKNLLTIELKDNELNDEALNENFIKLLKVLKQNNENFKIDLRGNQINCNYCYFKNFLSEMRNTTVSTTVHEVETLNCIMPNKTKSTFWETDFDCDSPTTDNTDSDYTFKTTRVTTKPGRIKHSFTKNKLLAFLISVIILSSFLVFLLNKNRKNIMKNQQRRYMMLRGTNNGTQNTTPSEEVTLNSTPKKKSLIKRLYNRLFKGHRRVPYEPFNDEYVTGSYLTSIPIYKRDETNEEVLMDRTSLNGSASNLFHTTDKDELIKPPTLGKLVILKTPT